MTAYAVSTGVSGRQRACASLDDAIRIARRRSAAQCGVRLLPVHVWSREQHRAGWTCEMTFERGQAVFTRTPAG